MIRIELRSPDGRQYLLDTPDPDLIGVWLKTVVDSWNIRAGTTGIPVEFTLRITS